MPRNRVPKPPALPPERQVSLCLSLLELYGASPEKDLYHAIDEVVMRKNRQIEKLEDDLMSAKGNWRSRAA